MFDIGNSAPPDQAEGQPWVVWDPRLGKITNTIVAGTAGQTVDSVIENPDGKTVTLRRVANGLGAYTMWMNAGGVMSVSFSPGTNGAAPGHILQYTMAAGDNPSHPSILSDLIDGGRTSVNLDLRTGHTWGTAYLDNDEQEVTVLSSDKVQQIFRTYHDEMGNPYTEHVGEIRPDMTGWYIGADGLRRVYNPDHSVDISGMDNTRTSQNLHITRDGQISGTLSNDVQARMVTITPNDTGSLEVTQDFRGKTLHITRFDLKGNPLRDWALGNDGKWLDYTRNVDGSTTFNQSDGTKIQVKDIWRYTVWNTDGSHKDYDESPKIDTRSFGQKLWDAADNAWDAGFEKGRGLVLGLGAMTGFNTQYNDIAELMGWDSKLPTQKIPFTNTNMRLDPITGLAYGMTTGILKGVFDTAVADFKTAMSTGKATSDWFSGKSSFADAAVRVWREAAFDSINARSQFFLTTDLRGATEHPSQTAGELSFGALTWFLPTKGIGRGIGAVTKAGVATRLGAAEAIESALRAIREYPEGGGIRGPGVSEGSASALGDGFIATEPPIGPWIRPKRTIYGLGETGIDAAKSYAASVIAELTARTAQVTRKALDGLSPHTATEMLSSNGSGRGGDRFYTAQGSGSPSPQGASVLPPPRRGAMGPATVLQRSNGASARQLHRYQPPAATFGPERPLAVSNVKRLYQPYVLSGRRRGMLNLPVLDGNTRFVQKENGLHTTIVTRADGTPQYIDTWATKNIGTAESPNWAYNRLLYHPLPNVVYRVNDRFLVRTDRYGRVVEAYDPISGIAAKPRGRNEALQGLFNVWRERVLGDFDAGHIFGDQFGGPAEPLFYTHQRRSVNQSPGQVYKLEQRLALFLDAISPIKAEYSQIFEYGRQPDRVGWRVIDEERIPEYYRLGYRLPGAKKWEERPKIANK
ncbi:DNA/RNA non-specific endonuclease [Nocardia tengchongensis]|uniref:hypothetical protein n=1 Tax=Nocardia tengchongensis TaxID=2055889 RepID=UPI003691F64A